MITDRCPGLIIPGENYGLRVWVHAEVTVLKYSTMNIINTFIWNIRDPNSFTMPVLQLMNRLIY